MKKGRITGFGGVFIQAENPKATLTWYQKHLGLITDPGYGASFEWRQSGDPDKKGYSVFSAMKTGSPYFQPSAQPFMLNFRVENLDELLESLESEGIEIIGQPDRQPYGTFAWILDPNGIKIELWEPVDPAYEEMVGETVHKT